MCGISYKVIVQDILALFLGIIHQLPLKGVAYFFCLFAFRKGEGKDKDQCVEIQ